MDEKKALELFANEAFAAKLSECMSLEDVQKAFAEQGADITLEQAEQFARSLQEGPAQGDEATEEDLEKVSGGMLRFPSLIWPLPNSKIPIIRDLNSPIPPKLRKMLRQLGIIK